MKIVAAIWLLCGLVLILIILIQKGRGGGLSSAFGGGMAGNILGSKTGDFLTWVTVVLVGIFILLSVVMAKFYKPTQSDFGAEAPTAGGRQEPAKPEGEPAPAKPEGEPAPAEQEGEPAPAGQEGEPAPAGPEGEAPPGDQGGG
jgi:preprotein translocase subunit SecG